MKHLTKEDRYLVGEFDKAGRFYISDFFKTETSEQVRSPSRAWPYSEWNHTKTAKYFKSLSVEQLEALGYEVEETE